jgi:hypothetical protein
MRRQRQLGGQRTIAAIKPVLNHRMQSRTVTMNWLAVERYSGLECSQVSIEVFRLRP